MSILDPTRGRTMNKKKKSTGIGAVLAVLFIVVIFSVCVDQKPNSGSEPSGGSESKKSEVLIDYSPAQCSVPPFSGWKLQDEVLQNFEIKITNNTEETIEEVLITFKCTATDPNFFIVTGANLIEYKLDSSSGTYYYKFYFAKGEKIQKSSFENEDFKIKIDINDSYKSAIVQIIVVIEWKNCSKTNLCPLSKPIDVLVERLTTSGMSIWI